MMDEMRRHWGVGVCEGAPLWSQASRLLRGRGCLAVMADRGPQPGSDPLRPPRWAAALAHRTGAPLVPGVIVRRPGGGYTVFLEPELSPEECRGGAWRRVLERYVRRYPEQWFAFEPGPRCVFFNSVKFPTCAPGPTTLSGRMWANGPRMAPVSIRESLITQ